MEMEKSTNPVTMRAHIFGYEAAMAFEPQEPTLVVRVWENETRDYQDVRGNWDNGPTAPLKGKYTAIIGHRFGDIDPDLIELYQSKEEADGMRKDLADRMLSLKTAKLMISEFASEYPKAKAVLFHCNAGRSRSPAVALAMQTIFGLEFEWVGRAKILINSFKKRQTLDWHKGPNIVGNLTIYNTLIKAGAQLQRPRYSYQV